MRIQNARIMRINCESRQRENDFCTVLEGGHGVGVEAARRKERGERLARKANLEDTAWLACMTGRQAW